MSNKLSEMQKMVATWVCEDCDKRVEMSYMDIVDVGTPICSSCDQDMTLGDVEDDISPQWTDTGDDQPQEPETPIKASGHPDDCCCSFCE